MQVTRVGTLIKPSQCRGWPTRPELAVSFCTLPNFHLARWSRKSVWAVEELAHFRNEHDGAERLLDEAFGLLV